MNAVIGGLKWFRLLLVSSLLVWEPKQGGTEIGKFHSGKASKGMEARRVGGMQWKRI